MSDELTAEQIAANEAAAKELVRGKYYRFDPPVVATGFPTGGVGVCPEQELEFDRGWYINLVDGRHAFSGKPINDPRIITISKEYAGDPDIVERMRECYFHVLFIGGSVASLDSNQEA